ncbi:MAG: hypothetical protein IKK92_08055 [Prevotella sp.]|nr:hypothetical protein [Prevotella sp.]
MATKELMISDWVHSTRYNVDAKIIDVNHDSVWLEVNGQWLRHLEEDVEPIKLTNEIMEKNFPDYEPGYTIGWWPNDDSSFHVEWQEDLEGKQVIHALAEGGASIHKDIRRELEYIYEHIGKILGR